MREWTRAVIAWIVANEWSVPVEPRDVTQIVRHIDRTHGVWWQVGVMRGRYGRVMYGLRPSSDELRGVLDAAWLEQPAREWMVG